MSIFRHSRFLQFRITEVFDAFRDPKRLARWWGPHGFTNSFETFEFRPGGTWIYTMHGPDLKNYPNESKFEEIVADALIRISHVSLPRYELTISLEPTEKGTKLSWTGIFENEKFAEKMRGFLTSANEQNLDRLEKELMEFKSEPS